jgi:hypothetical protein
VPPAAERGQERLGKHVLSGGIAGDHDAAADPRDGIARRSPRLTGCFMGQFYRSASVDPLVLACRRFRGALFVVQGIVQGVGLPVDPGVLAVSRGPGFEVSERITALVSVTKVSTCVIGHDLVSARPRSVNVLSVKRIVPLRAPRIAQTADHARIIDLDIRLVVPVPW